jgi:N-acetylated-alpha-linked acidic dipeptidase
MPFYLPPQTPMQGFKPETALAQRELEKRFDASIDANDQLAWLKRLSGGAHHVGSPYGLKNAEFMRDLYASFGLEARIETFGVLFASPKERRLEMGAFRAKLSEPKVDGDATSGKNKEALPTYNCYSCDGDVRGQLVYANYGLPADYEALAERGIDVKGKIVIVRYGGGWRGLKPKLAGEQGAIGCLIYSDPKDDGYAQGDEYPKGGWRDKNSAQRGSVADMPIYPGDPLTPNIGAVPGAPRLAFKDAQTLTKIPVLPISWGDAEPLLKDLTGPVAPGSWRGGLPFAYRMGPSKQEVHLKLKLDWKTVECRDVIATLKGSDLPDEWIMRGNHHDAWVYGGNDPLSGQVAMLSEAKAIGALAKSGWRPKRTIVFCSWDGEEPGLLGSTEFVETHLEELSKKAALYINSDTNGRGGLGVEGSHALERYITEVANDVTDVERPVSVGDRVRAEKIVGGDASAREKGDFKIGALGSGSDFSPFLQHAGISSINLGFGGEGEGTQYHSTYDSFDWQTRFADPGLVYGTVLSKTAGRLILRAANAESLPFRYQNLSDTISGYSKELVALETSLRTQTEEFNRRLDEGSLLLTLDKTETHVLPKRLDAVPPIALKPLLDAVERFKAAVAKAGPLSDAQAMAVERALLGPGLPGRPWYRHTLYAPGLLTGYGVKTFPGVREAMEARRWKEADEQAVVAAAALDAATAVLSRN